MFTNRKRKGGKFMKLEITGKKVVKVEIIGKQEVKLMDKSEIEEVANKMGISVTELKDKLDEIKK